MAVKGTSKLWAKFGTTFSYAIGIVVAGLCVWDTFDRFQKTWKNGKTIGKWGAGWDVVLSALFSAVTIFKAIALVSGASAHVLACYGVLNGGIVITALISSVVFAAVKWHQHRDPVAVFITTYGKFYRLLKESDW